MIPPQPAQTKDYESTPQSYNKSTKCRQSGAESQTIETKNNVMNTPFVHQKSAFRFKYVENSVPVQITVSVTSCVQILAYILHLFFHEFWYHKFWFCLSVIFILLLLALNQFKIIRLNYFMQKNCAITTNLFFVLVVQFLCLNMFPFSFVDAAGIAMSIVMLISICGLVAGLVFYLLQLRMNEGTTAHIDYEAQQSEKNLDDVMIDQIQSENLKDSAQQCQGLQRTPQRQKSSIFGKKKEKPAKQPKISQKNQKAQKNLKNSKSGAEELRPLCDVSPVPQFVKQAAKFILSHADREGLFRVSPDYTEL